MEENENKSTFKSIGSQNKKKRSFSNGVLVPFLSGILGACLVIGICFGVPEIKTMILGEDDTETASTTVKQSTTTTATAISLSDYSDTSTSVASTVLPSIVGIEIEYEVSSGMGRSTYTATATGSGIIISEDGYIVTNNHVVSASSSSSSSSSSSYYQVSSATSIKVTLYGDDEVYEAEIIGTDEETDIAVIKIDKTGLTAAEFGDSDSVQVGEFAMAIGSPLGLSTSVTCGIISAVNVTITTSDNETYNVIQTDAAINSGNSGGALVNSQGQVIGINALKLSGTGVEGLGFAIPINDVIDVINQLIEYNKVLRPYIGITGMSLDEATAEKYNLVVGVYVQEVEDFSAAQIAGIKAGDVIVEFDGEEVETVDEITELKNQHSIGDTVTVKVYRSGEYRELELTLGEE